MSDLSFDDYENENGYSDQGGESSVMKVLREKAEADSKRIAELTKTVERLAEQSRIAEVSRTFEAAGVNPKAAKFYTGDTSADAVTAWITENADVFGFQNPEGTGSPEVEPTGNDAVPEDVQNQFRQIQSAGSNAQPGGNADSAIGAMNAATSVEELFEAMRAGGFNGAAPF